VQRTGTVAENVTHMIAGTAESSGVIRDDDERANPNPECG